AVFIVGRHIEGQTQVLTTTIITDIEQAAYGHAIAVGIILLVIAGLVYSLLYRLQERTPQLRSPSRSRPFASRSAATMGPQHPRLFRGSVFYSVSYGLCVRGVESPELPIRTLQALEAVRLVDRLHARTSDLSAGEAQRVAFARAVVFRPDLLLLDEFAANLDPANARILEAAVLEDNRSE